MKQGHRTIAVLLFAASLCLSIAFLAVASVRNENSLMSSRNSNSMGQNSLKLPLRNPSIVVYKAKRQLELYDGVDLLRTYRIGLGFSPVGDKEREGDGRTPEGDFYVFVKNPRSAYHLSLGISYPTIEDAQRGLRDRLISKAQHDEIVKAINNKKAPLQDTPLGGLIYIHGNGSKSDWTLGCVALENADIKELFDAVEVGTPVKILP